MHAPEDKNGIRDHNMLPDIFLEYASRKSSPFVAVPERELGEGICQKAETVIRIREKLKTLDHLKFHRFLKVFGDGSHIFPNLGYLAEKAGI